MKKRLLTCLIKTGKYKNQSSNDIMGDGTIASFNTVSDAVNAAIKIQEACNTAKEFQLRIGIHLGEVVFENEDGVNITEKKNSITDFEGL